MKHINTSLQNFINESYEKEFLAWKRKNVTLRGMQNLDNSDDANSENGGMAKYGSGLYTAFLGNREMAKQYGKVYFVVNAIPKNPKVVYSVNEAEMFLQQIVTDYCKEKGVPRSPYYFYEETNIPTEMKKRGFDGLIIKGREMVNYFPPENVRYIESEEQLYQYYKTLDKI